MRLTWKDTVAKVFMAAIVVIYAAFLNSTSAWLIARARGTAAGALVLDIVGGCSMSAAGVQCAAAEQHESGPRLDEPGERARPGRAGRRGDREHGRARGAGRGDACAVAGGNGEACVHAACRSWQP